MFGVLNLKNIFPAGIKKELTSELKTGIMHKKMKQSILIHKSRNGNEKEWDI